MSVFNLGVVAPTHKGVYNSSTTYKARNIVTYNGGSYMAKQDCQGVSPENNDCWGLLAKEGNGNPSIYNGTFSTLKTDNSADKSKIYLIGSASDTVHYGHIAFWNGNDWVDSGEYAGVKDGSITESKTNFIINKGLMPRDGWVAGSVINVNDGHIQGFTGAYNPKYVDLTGVDALFVINIGNIHAYFYDSAYHYIGHSTLNAGKKIDVLENAQYCRFSIWQANLTENLSEDIDDVFSFSDYIDSSSYNHFKFKNTLETTEIENILINDRKLMILKKLYSMQADSLSIDGNCINFSMTNNDNVERYSGVFFKANFKAGDKLIITRDKKIFADTIALYTYAGNNLVSLDSSSFNDNKALFTITDSMIEKINDNNHIALFTFKLKPNSNENYKFKLEIENQFYSLKDFLDDYKEEKIKKDEKLNTILLGDSITALTGTRGWYNYMNDIVETNLVANVAVAGATLVDKDGTAYDGNPTSMTTGNVLGNQVQKILNNDYSQPDAILIAIGTNGGLNITEDDIYNSYYDSDKNLIALENVDRTTVAGAFRYCNETLKNKYPNSTIFWCAPIQGTEKTRGVKDIIKWGKNLQLLCQYGGAQFINTEECGITGVTEVQSSSGTFLDDGLHPNELGAKYMGHYNATKLLEYFKSCKLKNK